MAKPAHTKMYYSISEVAKLVDVEPYVLRFWEKEFPHLRPKKNRAGNRVYQPKDVERVMQVKHLLYDEGYTIQGARNVLRRTRGEPEKDPQVERVRKLIRDLRTELEQILKLFP